jgi:hypothetical protein
VSCITHYGQLHQGGAVHAGGTAEALKCPEDTEHRASVLSMPTVASVVPSPRKRKATEGIVPPQRLRSQRLSGSRVQCLDAHSGLRCGGIVPARDWRRGHYLGMAVRGEAHLCHPAAGIRRRQGQGHVEAGRPLLAAVDGHAACGQGGVLGGGDHLAGPGAGVAQGVPGLQAVVVGLAAAVRAGKGVAQVTGPGACHHPAAEAGVHGSLRLVFHAAYPSVAHSSDSKTLRVSENPKGFSMYRPFAWP